MRDRMIAAAEAVLDVWEEVEEDVQTLLKEAGKVEYAALMQIAVDALLAGVTRFHRPPRIYHLVWRIVPPICVTSTPTSHIYTHKSHLHPQVGQCAWTNLGMGCGNLIDGTSQDTPSEKVLDFYHTHVWNLGAVTLSSGYPLCKSVIAMTNGLLELNLYVRTYPPSPLPRPVPSRHIASSVGQRHARTPPDFL
jgi:hypothetical protein